MRDHGTRACYVWGPESGCVSGRGCRCEPCTVANRSAVRDAKRRVEPAYVSANPVRDHLAYLSENGIGWKTAARAGGLSPSVVWKILYGRDGKPSKRCRPETARKLLAVTLDAGLAGSRVDAAPTWQAINVLLGRGWTKSAINRALGNTSPALQIRKTTVERGTAARVRALLDEPVPGDVGKAWSAHHQATAQPVPEPEAVRYDARDRVTLALVELLEARIDQNGWRKDSACRGRPSWMFFPARGDHKALAAAKKVCGACFVRDECLAANLHERDGVYGGLSGHERRDLRREAVA